MTNFGRNIKKIRSIQKLSQAGFAEIFGLSRASVGAYEEGRAEAKLDLIIKIANYFSITVDDLINKDITVNELYHFNIFDENISGKINIGTELLKKIEFVQIPIVLSHDLLVKDISECVNESENFITLPYHSANHLALVVERDGFKYLPEKITDRDILIVFADFEFDKGTDLSGQYWLVKSSKNLLLGEIKLIQRNSILFFPESSIPVSVSFQDIDFILPLETIIKQKPEFICGDSVRLRKLEMQINDLYNRL